MLDHEPDTNDNPTAPSTTEQAPDGAPAPRRRRRAATRQAGPPVVSHDLEPTDAGGAAAPVMSAQSTPVTEQASTEQASSDRAGDAESPAASESGPASSEPETAPPAKKTARKRATKAGADGAPRTPRKRTTKKATAEASPQAEPDSTSAPAADSADAPEQTAAALDEIRTALTAELPPTELTVPPSSAQAEAPTDEAESADAGASVVDTQTADDPAAVTEPLADDETLDLLAAVPTPVDDAVADESPTADSDAEDDEDVDSDDDAGDAESNADDSGADDTDENGSPRRRRRRRGGRRRRRGGSDDRADDDQADDNRADDNRGGDNRGGDNRGGDNRTGGSRGGDQRADATPADSAPRDGGQLDGAQAGGEPAAGDEDGSGDESADGTSGRSGGRRARNRRSDAEASEESDGDEVGEDGQRRRRRRRRRRGEDSAPSADDPAEVVVRVREPRSRQKAAEEVTGIQGSTRMEAKRQRRREGREAGRRRAPILSEAEFLARRESVVRKMVIRQRDDLTQIAVLENDILVEHYVDRESAASLIGNVYLGRVQNVLPSMEAAFIDIGRGRNAVLYAGEVDWDAFGANGQHRKVENVLKSGQSVLVQVTKDPVGAKGARLTSHVTLPGRYIVYAPGGHLSGISRKLPDTERKRLKSVLSDLVPDSASVIVRTAAEGASEDELVRDVNRLKAQWEDIERKVKAGSAPKLLYGEPDLTVRIVRDLFTEDFADLVIQGNGTAADAYEAVDAYVGHVAPHLHDRMQRWDVEDKGDLFATYRLDEQISKALERKVFLPSGGSLIIDRTEAMTVIDVNTGKFTGSGGNLEATVTSNNLEAAEEIVRQLRLRDIGGIIVIDFIDMVLPANRELLLRRLVECLGRDRTRHQVAEVTSLGLVQMTRKKIGTGLLEAFTTECEVCHGRGYEISDVPVETQKQPDGGSRDHRGGGNNGGGNGGGGGNNGGGNSGGGRGRGRGNGGGSDRSGGGNDRSGGNGGGNAHKPVSIPPALRPDNGADNGADDGQPPAEPSSDHTSDQSAPSDRTPEASSDHGAEPSSDHATAVPASSD